MADKKVIQGFIGQLPAYAVADQEGNDRVEKPFAKPGDIKMFSGFGADSSDLERGFIDPSIKDKPEYDKGNYEYRWTEPRVSDDEDAGDMYSKMQDDFDFRTKDTRSRGLFTRPKNPTDR